MKIGSKKIFIDELRKIPAIKISQYQRFNDLRKYVMDKDIKTDYKPIKNNKEFGTI